MKDEAQAIAGTVANAILPRVHSLSPVFPFEELFRPFRMAEERRAAESAVAELVEATKARFHLPGQGHAPLAL